MIDSVGADWSSGVGWVPLTVAVAVAVGAHCTVLWWRRFNDRWSGIILISALLFCQRCSWFSYFGMVPFIEVRQPVFWSQVSKALEESQRCLLPRYICIIMLGSLFVAHIGKPHLARATPQDFDLQDYCGNELNGSPLLYGLLFTPLAALNSYSCYTWTYWWYFTL